MKKSGFQRETFHIYHLTSGKALHKQRDFMNHAISWETTNPRKSLCNIIILCVEYPEREREMHCGQLQFNESYQFEREGLLLQKA